MQFHPGGLVVKPLSANLKKDTDLFGKMDPYCNITVGSNTLKTKVAKDMGKTPSWQDVLNFRVAGEQSIYVAIYDHDTFGKDKFLGECTIQLNDIFIRRNMAQWYEIKANGQEAGQIMISFEFYPDGGK